MTRYSLTKQKRYMRWVEEQSQMHISTIHSFAYFMLKQLGIGESFTKGLSIRTFEYEKKELIKDAIDARVDEKKNVRAQLGVPFYRANAIVNDYWGKFSQLGVSHRDLLDMDWGEPVDEGSQNFHKIIKEMVRQLDDQYFDLKRQEEAISINDIMRDLQEVLMSGELPETDLSMKYLFIDEFQDSDLSQIKVACLLSKILGPVLFVVGDIKQSIYRFRGATDKAFQIFYKDLREMGLRNPVQLRLKPVMSVFKDMMDEESIVDNFIALNKSKRQAEGWEEARINADTFTRARQYQANLEKLMEVLQNNLGGDKVSLYDVYNFLKLNVATNRSEGEAKVQSKDDYTSVLCMTVHKSKGLEFDTVIVPFTAENFGSWAQTELLVDPIEKKVGWYYTGDKEKLKRRYKYPPMKSTYYDKIQANEAESGRLEGVRVLYVGMTRAIDTLICIIEESKNPMSWAKLIEEVGVDYE